MACRIVFPLDRRMVADENPAEVDAGLRAAIVRRRRFIRLPTRGAQTSLWQFSSIIYIMRIIHSTTGLNPPVELQKEAPNTLNSFGR